MSSTRWCGLRADIPLTGVRSRRRKASSACCAGRATRLSLRSSPARLLRHHRATFRSTGYGAYGQADLQLPRDRHGRTGCGSLRAAHKARSTEGPLRGHAQRLRQFRGAAQDGRSGTGGDFDGYASHLPMPPRTSAIMRKWPGTGLRDAPDGIRCGNLPAGRRNGSRRTQCQPPARSSH